MVKDAKDISLITDRQRTQFGDTYKNDGDIDIQKGIGAKLPEKQEQKQESPAR